MLFDPTAGGESVSRPALASPTTSEQSSLGNLDRADERKTTAPAFGGGDDADRPGGDDGAVGSSVAAAAAEAVPFFGSLRHPVTEEDP